MMSSTRVVTLLLFFAGLVLVLTEAWMDYATRRIRMYWTIRSKILLAERRSSLGGNVGLHEEELNANSVLMKYKQLEWDEGFQHPGEYPPNKHFFQGKPAIENSTVFKIIKRMPKGALLHTHDFGMLSCEGLLKLTYTPDLYVCDDEEEEKKKLRFKFLKEATDPTCFTGWKLLADLRNTTDNKIDERMRDALSLVVDDPHTTYPDVDAVSSKFDKIFDTVTSLLAYKPVFEEYLYQALQELYDDNITCVQIRTSLLELYNLEGMVYKDIEVVKIFKEIFRKFKVDHKKFIAAKLIYAPPRNVNNETMEYYIQTFKKIKKSYHDFVLGFDLVGHENKGTPLKDFVPHLLPLRNKYRFYFHAGETNWFGSPSDENLVDAIILGTKRIGHGYALLKHPELLKRVESQGIVVEVSPISNQVLNLVYDIKNHPGAVFGTMPSIPMVITNGNPSFWGAKGVSYDWYMAFMGMASAHSDLRYLKKLALNSIKNSGMDKVEVRQLSVQWSADWDEFVGELAEDTIQ